MAIIIGGISIVAGVILWMLHELPFERQDGKFVLSGDRKRLVAWLLMMNGTVGIILNINIFVIFLGFIIIVLIGSFIAEPNRKINAPFRPPPPRPAPPPVPQTLTPQLRARLEYIGQRGSVGFDMRYNFDKELKEQAEILARMGYLEVTETGPGGSLLSFRPTDKALEILTAPTPPKPVQPPTEPTPQTLTPEQRATLLEVIEKGKLQFDYRYDKGKAAFRRCLELEKMGYLSVTETGPGDSVQIFKPTPAGRAARSAPPPGTPQVSPPPDPSRMLTDDLRAVLQYVAQNNRVYFDTRSSNQNERYEKCRKLAGMGYLTIEYDGPGDAIEFYSLTDKGRAALNEN